METDSCKVDENEFKAVLKRISTDILARVLSEVLSIKNQAYTLIRKCVATMKNPEIGELSLILGKTKQALKGCEWFTSIVFCGYCCDPNDMQMGLACSVIYELLNDSSIIVEDNADRLSKLFSKSDWFKQELLELFIESAQEILNSEAERLAEVRKAYRTDSEIAKQAKLIGSPVTTSFENPFCFYDPCFYSVLNKTTIAIPPEMLKRVAEFKKNEPEEARKLKGKAKLLLIEELNRKIANEIHQDDHNRAFEFIQKNKQPIKESESVMATIEEVGIEVAILVISRKCGRHIANALLFAHKSYWLSNELEVNKFENEVNEAIFLNGKVLISKLKETATYRKFIKETVENINWSVYDSHSRNVKGFENAIKSAKKHIALIKKNKKEYEVKEMTQSEAACAFEDQAKKEEDLMLRKLSKKPLNRVRRRKICLQTTASQEKVIETVKEYAWEFLDKISSDGRGFYAISFKKPMAINMNKFQRNLSNQVSVLQVSSRTSKFLRKVKEVDLKNK